MEIVEDANELLLKDPERYFFFIRDQVERIIKDYGIKYAEVMDNKKTYPAFTRKQFVTIIQALYNRVYKPNKALLYDNIYINRYDISKVEQCYTVFKSICLYYSITPSGELFTMFSGIDKHVLVEWLNTGKSPLLKVIVSDIQAIDNFEMLNSANSLLRLYYRNNQEVERIEEGTLEVLPDLLALETAQKSLPDGQKAN